jgi:hypothetical protein
MVDVVVVEKAEVRWDAGIIARVNNDFLGTRMLRIHLFQLKEIFVESDRAKERR